jgi:hypothetical protein
MLKQVVHTTTTVLSRVNLTHLYFSRTKMDACVQETYRGIIWFSTGSVHWRNTEEGYGSSGSTKQELVTILVKQYQIKNILCWNSDLFLLPSNKIPGAQHFYSVFRRSRIYISAGEPVDTINIFRGFLISSTRRPVQYLELNHDSFLPHPFQFITP